MKPRIQSTDRLSLPLASAIAALLAAQSAQAQRFWDNNGDTAGFGDAAGTWTDPTVSQWSTSNAGTAVPTASYTTLIGDAVNFGSAGTALGAGTISVSGTVNALNMTFGATSPSGILIDGGTINLAGTTFISVANSAATQTISSLITGAATSLTKSGGGTLVLSGLSGTAANNYSGPTTVAAGTLTLNHPTTANLTGGLTFGASNTATAEGNLNLSAASATFAGPLVVRGNNATAHNITIGSGKTLQINGAVTVGPTNSTSTFTRMTATGLGTLSVGTSVTATNANMTIGGGNADTIANSANLDMSGLSTFYANLGTGTFRVGSSGGANPASTSTVTLAVDSTIVATNLTIASRDGSGGPKQQTLKLGTGTNVIHATNIYLGAGPGTSDGRANGSLIFNTAAGTLTLRGLTGDDTRANMSVAVNGFGGATPGFGLFDSKGHTADLLLETLIVGKRSTGSAVAPVQGQFDFDMGTLDVNDLEVGISSGAGSATGNVNLGGGTTTVNNTVKATLLGGRTVGTFGTGNLNISGSANVNIAAFGGTSLILGDAVAAGSATGAVNLTGGTLTVAGDIIRGTATGTSVATLALNGASATLDMGGNDITGMTGITYTAGLLKNLGTVNTGMTLAGTGSRVFDQTTGVNGDIQGEVTGSGIGFTKQGDGKLTLSGTNTYDGATLVSAGTLFVTGSLTSDVTVSDAATFGGGGTVQAISFGGGSFLDIFLAVNSLDSLASSTISFAGAGFGIDNLVSQGAAVDWNTVLNGNYTLITGGLDETNLANFGLANAVSIGGGRSAYFEEGSLTLVVIPEPRAALLGGLGLLALLRRRRH